MPKSSVRKKKVYTAPPEMRPQSTAAAHKPSPPWVAGTALGLVVFAIVWLVVYYLSSGWADFGDSFNFLYELRYWNLLIGFGAMVAALVMFTRWR
ncbi:hypothetical protein GCM10009682_05200 [Luedemannella flava]|uniref:Cell division protein CrgA n=1 Tax=Luedemannella flava TaxID=349316 RepID=A0ABP4XKE1_9ACTN